MNGYDTKQISRDLFALEDNGVRAFLLIGTDTNLLIDTCYGNGDIKAEAERLGDGMPLIVVNTHSDGDHTGGNHLFPDIHIHPEETARLSQNAKGKLTYNIIPLAETIVELEIILLPGHTPGSIALLDRKNKRVFTGDIISDAYVWMFGEGRNLDAYLRSLKTLRALAVDGAFGTIYCAHGSVSVGADVIDSFISGTEKILKGELPGEKPPFDVPALVYDTGAGKILA